MRLPPLRFAQRQWRAGKRIYRRHIARHRHAVMVGLRVLGGGGLLLATVSGRHGDRTPGPTAARPPAGLSEPVPPQEDSFVSFAVAPRYYGDGSMIGLKEMIVLSLNL